MLRPRLLLILLLVLGFVKCLIFSSRRLKPSLITMYSTKEKPFFDILGRFGTVEFLPFFRPFLCDREKTCFRGYYSFLFPSATDTPVCSLLPFTHVDSTSSFPHSCATFDTITLSNFENLTSADFFCPISKLLTLARLAYIYCEGEKENFWYIISPR
jgi:hypothetical protein